MVVIYLIGLVAGVFLFGFGKHIKKFEVKLFLAIVLFICCLVGGVYSCVTEKHSEWDRFEKHSIKP